MSQPFLIVNIVDGALSSIYQREKYFDAIELAVQLALEQTDCEEEAVRKELNENSFFLSEDETIDITITTAQED